MNETFNNLLDKYLLETITKEEAVQLFALLEEPGHQAVLKERIGNDFLENTYIEAEDLQRRERIKEKLSIFKATEKRPAKLFALRRVAAAAAVLVLLGSAAFFLVNKPGRQLAQQPVKSPIVPGGNKALLTLANGTAIVLDSAGNGILAQQGGTSIQKNLDGQIGYYTSTEKPTNILFNTLSTPAGGQYKLTLADGTMVWLNASSSITYPTTFTGNERKVSITGEVYFEVTKNAAMPFRLTSNGVEVEVLGTHFDVMAYADEHMVQTTLLEGAVNIKAGARTYALLPGDQGVILEETRTYSKNKLQPADLEEVVAWKNGMFQFNSASIETIMKQVARWYDVEIVYNGKFPPYEFVATISRNEQLSKLLEKLALTNKVRFEITGRKILVTPQ